MKVTGLLLGMSIARVTPPAAAAALQTPPPARPGLTLCRRHHQPGLPLPLRLLLQADLWQPFPGAEPGDGRGGDRLPPGKGIAGWVAQNQRPLVVDNVRQDPRFYPDVDEAFGFQTRSLAAVPLLDRDRILGVLEAVNKTYDREFSDEDHDLLMVAAHLASVALVRAEAFTEQSAEG